MAIFVWTTTHNKTITLATPCACAQGKNFDPAAPFLDYTMTLARPPTKFKRSHKPSNHNNNIMICVTIVTHKLLHVLYEGLEDSIHSILAKDFVLHNGHKVNGSQL